MTSSAGTVGSLPVDGPLAQREGVTSFLMEKAHFKLLDGLRALSIFAVVWHHSSGDMPLDLNILKVGFLGVPVFFVLSGFLITFLLLKEKAKAGAISFKKFYIRRSLRIFPLYYAYLFFLTVWLMVTQPEMAEGRLGAFPYYLFYVSNFIPLEFPEQFEYFARSWSLSVEEQFYLFWPISFASLTLVHCRRFALALVLGLTAIDLWPSSGNTEHWIDALVQFRALLLGCLLAIHLSNPRHHAALYKVFGHPWSIVASIALLLAFLSAIDGALNGWKFLVTHLLITAIVASAVINEENVLGRVLSFRPLAYCGVLSYGIYILHSQFQGVAAKFVGAIPVASVAGSRVTFFFVFLSISIGIAALSYRYFESYFLRLKNRVGY